MLTPAKTYEHHSPLNINRGGICMKGQIYKVRGGHQVRCGRKITKYFKKKPDAENFIDELNITPNRLKNR